MKARLQSYLVLIPVLFLFLGGCRSTSGATYPRPTTSKQLPPGQAKKMYGHQSAKAFAPGQQKKQGNKGTYNKKVIRMEKEKGKNLSNRNEQAITLFGVRN